MQKPVLQALVVADHVYIDRVTGKKIVAGIFHKITRRGPAAAAASHSFEEGAQVKIAVPEGGHNAGSPFAYISMTEIHGEQAFDLRYVSLRDDRHIFSTSFKIESPDPLQTVDMAFPLPSLPHKEGVYALELVWNDEPLGMHRIQVVELKEEN